jgi:hypothetical protein
MGKVRGFDEMGKINRPVHQTMKQKAAIVHRFSKPIFWKVRPRIRLIHVVHCILWPYHLYYFVHRSFRSFPPHQNNYRVGGSDRLWDGYVDKYYHDATSNIINWSAKQTNGRLPRWAYFSPPVAQIQR